MKFYCRMLCMDIRVTKVVNYVEILLLWVAVDLIGSPCRERMVQYT